MDGRGGGQGRAARACRRVEAPISQEVPPKKTMLLSTSTADCEQVAVGGAPVVATRCHVFLSVW